PSPTPSPGSPVGRPTLSRAAGEGLAAAVAVSVSEAEQSPLGHLAPMPQSFAEVVALFDEKREALLRSHLYAHVRLVAFEPGRIEFRPIDGAPRDLANRLGQLLGEWTGARWIVAVSQAEGAPSLAEAETERAGALRNEIAAHPLVQAALETFPGATIAAVRERFDGTGGETAGVPLADGGGDADIGGDEPEAGEEEP
ncbi:MAG: DNA polymerase III subunit gamma/tau, partial [Candidatus Eiseniibacteriota bacterium]